MLQSDHEKQTQRASAAEPSAGGSSGPSWASKEIAALDTGRDFSLKEGETIKINIKRPGSSGSTRAPDTGFGTSGGNVPSIPLKALPASQNTTRQVGPHLSSERAIIIQI